MDNILHQAHQKLRRDLSIVVSIYYVKVKNKLKTQKTIL